MNLPVLLLGLLPVAGPAPPAAAGGTFAIRVARAETVSQGTIENAVILVDDGKFVTVGEDLPIERGIPIIDCPDMVAVPGLVNCYSRVGMDSRGPSGAFEPQRLASGELYARQDLWEEVLETGVTTLGLRPAGSGIPGKAVAVKPHGTTPEEMILADEVYLQVQMATDPKAKKRLRDGFEKADAYEEKTEEAREKWEAKNKKKSSKKKKKDDDDDDKKSSSKSKKEDKFVPKPPDDKVQVFLDLREEKIRALMQIDRASDWLHLIDVLGDEEITWDLQIDLRDDIDIWNVEDRIGRMGVRVVMPTRLTTRAHTRREINLPKEFAESGAKVVLTPRSDSLTGHRQWMWRVSELVRAGLPADTALRAMTLEPAAVLGLDERIGSIEAGKDANLVLLSGDPFEVGTEVEAVMIQGELVHGEVN